MISDHRLTIVRLAVYVDPRDIWVGVYVSPRAVYVCMLPLLVFRWDRRAIRLGRRRLPPIAPVGCDDCPTEPGERHDRTCPKMPKGWFDRAVVVRGSVR